MNGADLKGLESRGFALIPSFLSEAEIRECREDFGQHALQMANRNYEVTAASPRVNERLAGRVQEVLALVTSKTDLRPNLPLRAAYFANRKIKFSWHQDHESFFAVQNHYDYLNFYIPIVKPSRDKSNLSIIPFDALEQESPSTFRKVVRGGASRFIRFGNSRLVFLDDTGSTHLMRRDINQIAHTPPLAAGDLLLLRGDVIHRTQDVETERVAVSFRAANAETLVRRSRLVDGGWYKAKMMMNNPANYEAMFRAFDQAGKDVVGALEYMTIVSGIDRTKPKSSREFLRYLLAQKRREHLLSPFLRRTVTSVLTDRVVSLDERWRRHYLAD